jgi:hypothetical protein
VVAGEAVKQTVAQRQSREIFGYNPVRVGRVAPGPDLSVKMLRIETVDLIETAGEGNGDYTCYRPDNHPHACFFEHLTRGGFRQRFVEFDLAARQRPAPSCGLAARRTSRNRS